MPRNDEFDDPTPRRRPRYDDEDDERRPPPKKSNVGLILAIIGGVLLLVCGGGGVLVVIAINRAAKNVQQGFQQVAKQMEEAQQAEQAAETSRQNLTQIGFALHKHHDNQRQFPNNSYDRAIQNRPLLSWRVHLLPYLGQEALFKQFNLNEPWDSPTNIRLLNQMPAVYGTPEGQAKAGPNKTYYRGFSHKGAMFEKPANASVPPTRFSLNSVQDGTINTIMVIEAGEPIEWTKPEDIDWSPGRSRPSLGGVNSNAMFVMVLMVDGSVRRMRKDVNDQTFRWLIDRQDGNVIPPGWED